MGQKNEDSLKKNSFGGINNNSLEEGGMKEGMEKGLTEREGRGEGEAALVSDVIYAATAEQLAPSAFILATKIMV